MQDYRIVLTETRVKTEADNEVTTYGFSVITHNGRIEYGDLTDDKAKALSFLALLSSEKPELKILPELVEDFIV